MKTEEKIVAHNICQARNLFKTQFSPQTITQEETASLLASKIHSEYEYATKHFQQSLKKQSQAGQDQPAVTQNPVDSLISQILKQASDAKQDTQIPSLAKYEKNIGALEESKSQTSVVLSKKLEMNLAESTKLGTIKATSLRKLIKPKWHRPFKLYRVIVGHHGWVRCLAISPCNTYFASGSADRTVKFWDLASGELKISLTGHINTIRAVQFSKQHPYLFSCGEDKSIKCWDLQMNKVIRNYHGHLSGVYCMKIHEGLGVLVSGGRDSTARVWDVRVRKQIHALVGHSHTVGSVITQESEPHVITGSYDSFIKMWDIGSGRCINTLTNHKKSVRALVQHPSQYTFASAASDNIKVWKCPNGYFLRNIAGHNSILDALAINQDNVLVSGGDDGSLKFWDWESGYNFQDVMCQPQPGSIAAENGIFSLTFDRSGCRLLSGECDKTIKMWREDENATEQTHPIKEFKMQFDRS